jgi:hypothetical protein
MRVKSLIAILLEQRATHRHMGLPEEDSIRAFQ